MNILDSRKLDLAYQAIEAFGKLDLPETLDLDILKGQLFYLAEVVSESKTRKDDYEPREIYNNLIAYGAASAVIRNTGGKFIRYFGLLNNVFAYIVSNWEEIKEKVKNIPSNIHDAAEAIIDESESKLTFYYAVSATLPIGFVSAIATKVNMTIEDIVYLVTITGAIVGCALFLFNDIFNYSSSIQNLIRTIDIFTERKLEI